MKLIEALGALIALKQAAVTVNDAAALWGVSRPHAAKILERLAAAAHVVRLRQGLWAFPDKVEPLALPEYLAAPAPAYVSLYSALHFHGWIAQIPSVVYAVTLRRPGRVVTPLGVVSFHRVAPEFFFGFEPHGVAGVKVATPEKALMDIFYLDSGRSPGWRALPEVEPARGFKIETLCAMAGRIRSPTRRRAVLARIERLRLDLSRGRRKPPLH